MPEVIAKKELGEWSIDVDPECELFDLQDVYNIVDAIYNWGTLKEWNVNRTLEYNRLQIEASSDADFTGALKQYCEDNDLNLKFGNVPVPQRPGDMYPTNYEVPCAAAAAEEAAEAAEAAARSGRPVLIDSMAYARHPSFIPSTSDDEYAAELDREAEALVDILDDSDMEVDLVSGACPMSELIHTRSICLRL